jgi:outer membrane immunogenic protein
MKNVWIAGIVAAAIATPAMAADMGLPLKAPPVPYVSDWSGVYVGLEGGYGWGQQDIDATYKFYSVGAFIDPTGSAVIGSVNQSGGLFGGFVGAQKQWNNWVLGVEANFDGADIDGSTSGVGGSTGIRHTEVWHDSVAASSKIDELGSVRAKIGYQPVQNWLVYGTGGLAFAHETYSATATQTCTGTGFAVPFICSVPGNVFSATGSGGNSMLGWAAGAGVDWKWNIDAGSSLILGAEYLHYQFPTSTIVGSNNANVLVGNLAAVNSTQSVDAVMLRLSYLFSIH